MLCLVTKIAFDICQLCQCFTSLGLGG